MPSLVLKRYEGLLQQMINTVVARTNPPLVDITDSSAFKHLLAAPARELDEVYYQLGLLPDLFSIDTAVGEDLDARAAEIQPALLSRNQATKATGTLVFSRSGTSGTVTITAGTVAKTSSKIMVATTEDTTIASGATASAPVGAVAQEGGASGNVAAGTLVLFENKPSGVEYVTNPSTFVGGTDKETDDAFRARIKAFISTLARGTVEALEFIATGVTISNGQRVAYAKVVEDFINRGEVYLYVDDGSGTAELSSLVTAEVLTQGLGGPVNDGDSAVGGEVFLYTNLKPVKVDLANVAATITVTSGGTGARGVLVYGTDFLLDDTAGQFKFTPALVTGETITVSYVAFTGLIAEVQKIIDGVPSDRTNYPGWRAAGVRVHVLPPVIYQQLINATVLVLEGYTRGTRGTDGTYTSGSVLAQVAEAISAYVNGLGISGDIIKSELIAAAMGVAGVGNVTITSPLTDVILLDNQLPRVTTSNIILA